MTMTMTMTVDIQALEKPELLDTLNACCREVLVIRLCKPPLAYTESDELKLQFAEKVQSEVNRRIKEGLW